MGGPREIGALSNSNNLGETYPPLRPVRPATTLLLDVVAPIYELLVGYKVTVIVTEPRIDGR